MSIIRWVSLMPR